MFGWLKKQEKQPLNPKSHSKNKICLEENGKQVLELAKDMDVGQIFSMGTAISVDWGNKPFISFLIKDTDFVIKNIPKDPIIAFDHATITVKGNNIKDVFILFVLVRINNNQNTQYTIPFSLANTMLEDVLTLSEQSRMQIVICGESEMQCVRVITPKIFRLGINARIGIASSKVLLNWSQQDFLQALKIVFSQVEAPSKIWEFLEENNKSVDIFIK